VILQLIAILGVTLSARRPCASFAWD